MLWSEKMKQDRQKCTLYFCMSITKGKPVRAFITLFKAPTPLRSPVVSHLWKEEDEEGPVLRM